MESKEEVAPSGVEGLRTEVREILDQLYSILSTNISRETLQSLSNLKEKVIDLYRQAMIQKVDTEFKKKIISLTDNSIIDANWQMLNDALTKAEQDEKFRKTIEYLLTLNPLITIDQGSVFISLIYYLSFRYQNVVEHLYFGKLYYESDNKKLTLIIGDRSGLITRISTDGSDEYQNLEDQLKGIVTLINEYENTVKDYVGGA